jgi:hypothetical protein
MLFVVCFCFFVFAFLFLLFCFCFFVFAFGGIRVMLLVCMRCPAQGQRVKYEGKARMPAHRPEQPNRPRRAGSNTDASAKAKNQNARAAQPQEQKKPTYDADLTSGSANIDNPCTISRNICVT